MCLDTYRKLWNIYPEAAAAKIWKKKAGVGSQSISERYHFVMVTLPAVFVVVLVLCAFALDAEAVWEALG